MTPLYNIQSVWPGRPDSPARIGERFLETLDALSQIDPLLRDWGYFDEDNIPTGIALTALRPSYTSFVASHVWRDEYDDPEPSEGYMVWASSLYSPRGTATSQTAQVLVHAGSHEKNNVSFSIGSDQQPPDPERLTYALFKSVVLTIARIWHPVWVDAMCYCWGERPAQASGDPAFPYSGFQMPWLAYLNAEQSAGLAVPTALRSERTADGGLLLTAATTRLDPADAGHMARSKAIAQILIERGNPAY